MSAKKNEKTKHLTKSLKKKSEKKSKRNSPSEKPKELNKKEKEERAFENSIKDKSAIEKLRLRKEFEKKQEEAALTTLEKEDKLHYVNDWVNVEWIKNGIVKTKDGRYVAIVEIEPVSFYSKTEDEQESILDTFTSWLKIAPDRFCIRIETENKDTTDIIETTKKRVEQESSEKVRQRGAELVNHIEALANNRALTKKFYIIFEHNRKERCAVTVRR